MINLLGWTLTISIKTSILDRKDFEKLNVQNKFESIHPDLKRFVNVSTEQKISSELSIIERELSVYRQQNPDSPDVRATIRMTPTPHKSRLAFPINLGEYATYRDLTTANFYIDLYNGLQVLGITEPRLLVNHAFEQPWYTHIYPREDYKTHLGITEGYCGIWHNFLRILAKRTPLEEITLYAHKNTSPGPPFAFADGGFYSKDDIVYGPLESYRSLSMTSLRKDFSKVKASYFSKINTILERQLEVASNGLLNYGGRYVELYKQCILPTAVPGFRKNSIDKPMNVNGAADRRTVYYTPNRNCTIFLRDRVLQGEINNEALTHWLISNTGTKHGFATQRSREITVISWPSQLPSAILSKMITHWVETSVNGFASTSTICLEGYNAFIAASKLSGNGDFMFLNGDRTNSETFITSNYEEFKKLILPEFCDLYEVQNTMAMFSNIVYCVTGCLSGIAKTTELNWMMGVFEACFTISSMLRESITEVIRAYTNAVLKNEAYFEQKGFKIKLFMPTDDIPLIIYGDLAKLDLRVLKRTDRLMKWDMSYSEMSTFGMRFTKDGMSASPVSVMSKLFYSEHPGFFVKDCYSISSKLSMLSREELTLVNELLKKHYSIDKNFYDLQSQGFLSWLQQLGVPLQDVYDLYSPSGKIAYGSLVDSDTLLQSARVPEDSLAEAFHYYKKTFQKETDNVRT